MPSSDANQSDSSVHDDTGRLSELNRAHILNVISLHPNLLKLPKLLKVTSTTAQDPASQSCLVNQVGGANQTTIAAKTKQPIAVADYGTLTEFSSLPLELLITVAFKLLPAGGLSDSPAAWSAAMRFTSVSTLTHGATLEAIRHRVRRVVPDGESISPAALIHRIGLLLAGGGGRSKWRLVRPLQAVLPRGAHSIPILAAPRLSGASLCCVAPHVLCVFGGRNSTSGDTVDATYLATMRGGVAIWEKLLPPTDMPWPPARCYHSGTSWIKSTPGGRRRQLSAPTSAVLVFGGAGEGEGSGESSGSGASLLNDLWMLSVSADCPGADTSSPGGGGGKSSARPAQRAITPCPRWTALHPKGPPPQARSSHICAPWPAERALVFHGGLTSNGVGGDVFLLRGVWERSMGVLGDDGEWVAMQTSGAEVKRAHHVGGVVGEATLLVFSGQGATLITTQTLAALDMRTWSWSSLPLPLAGPMARIDGAGMAIDDVGLIVFGGVGNDFSFVPAEDAWLLRNATDVQPRGRLARHPAPTRDADSSAASVKPDTPPPRACLGLCASGHTICMFGGFDGERDLNDLWTLELLPTSAGAAASSSAAPELRRRDQKAAEALDVEAFKARQARACAVIHSTPTADTKTGMPLHILVRLAAEAVGKKAIARPCGSFERESMDREIVPALRA